MLETWMIRKVHLKIISTWIIILSRGKVQNKTPYPCLMQKFSIELLVVAILRYCR